jgi:hypothetical protein
MKRKGEGGRSLRKALSSSYWRDSQARLVLDAWQESGLSLKAFADRHGIGRSRLQRWKTQLESDRAVTFHPVQVVLDPAAQEDVSPDSNGHVELVLRNGRRIAVGRGFDVAALERLVEVAESWPC